MSAFAYDSAAADLARGELSWPDDDVRVVLVNDSYRPRQSSDTTRDDLGAAEVVEPLRLIGRKIDDSEAGRLCLCAGAVRWQAFTGDFRYAVVFNNRSNRLIAYSDLGPQRSTNGIVVLDYPDGEVCELVLNFADEDEDVD